MRVLLLFLFLAAPAGAQVWRASVPEGPVLFEKPDTVLVFVAGQTARDFAVVPAGGAVATVVRNWTVDVWFYEYGTRARIIGEPTLDVGDRIAVCAVVLYAGELVAVDDGCGCVEGGGWPTYWPGAVTYSSDDPAIASVDRTGNLCDGGA